MQRDPSVLRIINGGGETCWSRSILSMRSIKWECELHYGFANIKETHCLPHTNKPVKVKAGPGFRVLPASEVEPNVLCFSMHTLLVSEFARLWAAASLLPVGICVYHKDSCPFSGLPSGYFTWISLSRILSLGRCQSLSHNHTRLADSFDQ